MDESGFEQAEALAQAERDRAIRSARGESEKREAEIAAAVEKGDPFYCLWCEAEVAPGRRFCDADCASDHTRSLKLRG